MPTQVMGSLFEPVLVKDIFTKVAGKSVLTKLSKEKPVSFTGNDIFVFDMPGEVGIVAEAGAKPHGGIDVQKVTVAPIKVVYQGRVSDEFMTATAEARIDIMQNFTEGFAKKLAVGIDKIYIHGINPATGTASQLIGSNFDTDVINTVTLSAGTTGDAAIEAAAQLLGTYDATGIAMSKTFAATLAAETEGNSGVRKFPELAWGGSPDKLRALDCAVSSTVGTDDLAIVGDFSAFRWGYAKEVKFEVIEYGDPDNSGVDLKAYNQVMLRAEAYIGGAVVDPDAFARIIPPAANPGS